MPTPFRDLRNERMRFAATVVIACLALLLAGCAATVVKRDKPFVLEKKSVVVLRQGHELQARRVAVEADSLSVTGRYSGVETRIPMREVGKVVELNAFSGMMRGAVAGFGIGLGSGLIVGALADGGCEGAGCSAYIPPIIAAPIIGVIWGVPAGAVYGLLRGRGAAYRFEDSTGRGGDKDSLPASAPEAVGALDSTRAPAPEPLSSQDPGQAYAPTGSPTPPSPSSSSASIRELSARERIARDTAREEYSRGRFYLGAGFGYGLGKMPSGSGAHVGHTLAPGWFIPMHLGMNIDPRWSAGLRYTVGEMQHRYTVKRGSGAFGDGPLHDYGVWDGAFMHAFEAEARWHPHEKDLFLTGSAGYLTYTYTDGSDEDIWWYREGGFTASVGAGYAWNAWSIVNLVAGADLVGGVSANGSGSWMIRPTVGIMLQ